MPGARPGFGFVVRWRCSSFRGAMNDMRVVILVLSWALTSLGEVMGRVDQVLDVVSVTCKIDVPSC